MINKKLYTQEGLYGGSSIINVGSFIDSDKRMNFVYYGTAMKIFLCLCIGQLLQF